MDNAKKCDRGHIIHGLIQMDIGGHPPIPNGSSCQFLVQHVLMYFFVIMGSTLLGLFEVLHIFQVDTVASHLIQLPYFVCFHVSTSCCTSRAVLEP
jgi:hypothetical protein